MSAPSCLFHTLSGRHSSNLCALTASLCRCLPAQVTDTPGLLNRPDEFKNKMEMLTLATLEYLPSQVRAEQADQERCSYMAVLQLSMCSWCCCCACVSLTSVAFDSEQEAT